MVDKWMQEQGYTISSPCEPDSSGELINHQLHDKTINCNVAAVLCAKCHHK